MNGGLGASSQKAKFTHMFSTNRAVNVLAAARVFFFGARDVWFAVALPVFLYTVLGWTFWQVGGFMAVWIIGYGIVQATCPRSCAVVTKRGAATPDGVTATWLAFMLAGSRQPSLRPCTAAWRPHLALPGGLILFGLVFALNSAVHSFLILHFTDSNKVAMNVGFYYMANACGRLAGTVCPAGSISTSG